ncbi:MAG: hypothetical protein CFE23_14640 [Flavobacterium sp. BFFFF1]|uniref:hypothetical protein n=1 Tax=Flavobacterium sp. BFFFF1 TaxID=2015557 RepID=UPI000BD78450|nr:hypothetical protein [Flavobacterium sp. BFFFF1]OYU79340.1 MAG: hypothetical protein CFE23_14640 [Flavobacterium sp. BFFFF1]
MKKICLALIILQFYSCEMSKKINVDSTPLSTVVKFISSESFIDTVEAKKYIDIEKVYSKYIDNENASAQKVWENRIAFLSNLSNDKKFTPHFKFYNYTISEQNSKKISKITFTSKRPNEGIKAIEYSLALDAGENWKIIDIEYRK